MSQSLFLVHSAPESERLSLSQDIYRLLVAPAAIGFTIGWVGIGNQSRFASAGIWSLLWLLSWQANDLTARLLAPALHRRKVSLPVLLSAGFVAPSLICILLNLSFGPKFRQWFGSHDLLQPLAISTPWHMISSSIATLFFWLAVNMIFCRLNDAKLFGLEWASSRNGSQAQNIRSGPKPMMPAFMMKVRPSLRGKVIAVNAERHYVRIFTALGDDLIYYRFRDAVTDFETFGGIQVHRSWCIAADEIEKKAAQVVLLRNGMVVPTSRSFRRLLRNF